MDSDVAIYKYIHDSKNMLTHRITARVWYVITVTTVRNRTPFVLRIRNDVLKPITYSQIVHIR